MLPVCYLALAALLCATALAQEKPDAPKPKHDRKEFIAGTALLAASATADAISTRQLVDRGGREANPLLGHHPSNGRLAGEFAAEFVMHALVFHFTERSHRPVIRWMGRTFIGVTIEEHSRLAACNGGIDVHLPGQNCSILGF